MTSRWIRPSGILAIAGGAMALLLTLPFAAAYFIAYPGYDELPFWFDVLMPVLEPMIGFGHPDDVYTTYGKIYNPIYLLLLPATLALHDLHRGTSSRLERWGFAMTMIGLIVSFVGVAGDYWANGAGFLLEVVGLLVLAVGCSLTGFAARRSRIIPSWCAWLLVLCLPGYIMWFILIGHIPSGHTVAVAVAYVGVGFVLLSGPRSMPHPAGTS